ncbi:hypothetical protein [Mesorhizobium ventifaucium]|uniref:Uncharacterized protein n=1 Tax=Mesorhizobium ventifaucium TaxID=666020 RepID=A0ABN8JNM4_9HYPH|nr:hypothetical protein [Mesorhizobium ventifaucium]CAH2399108.1 hypothetical protein MES4922_210097 [Mesorhizobium ventifaucium]
MERFRKGDRVSIETTVRHDQREDDWVFLDIGSGATVDASLITMIAPHFDAGDFVAASYGKGEGAFGHVKAVSDKMVWVKHASGDYATYDASMVRRLDPEAFAPVEIPTPTAIVDEIYSSPVLPADEAGFPTGAAPDLADAAHFDAGPMPVGEDEVVF